MPEFLNELLFVTGSDLNLIVMAVRAGVVFIAAVVIVRWGDKRFLGRNSAFDIVLSVILGSVLSRTINGSAPLLPTMAAGVALVGMHILFANLAFRSGRFSNLIKGSPRQLVKDGEIQWEGMRKGHISRGDLETAARSGGGLNRLDEIDQAFLERSGDISIIPKTEQGQIVEVTVAEGVQTVRIQIEK